MSSEHAQAGSEVAAKAGPITFAVILVLAILEAFLLMSGQSGW